MAKLHYEDIKKEVEDAGWELISTSYSNLKQEMNFKCPEGHMNYISLEKWRRNYKCPTCEANPFNNEDSIVSTKKNGFRILALDQASITSGWAIFDDDKLITHGAWTSSGQHNVERISQTKGWLTNMIMKWKPDLVVMEDIQLQVYGNKGNTSESVTVYKKLAALQGVLKNYCFEIGVPYKIVYPATWRAYSEIKGKSRTDRKRNAQLKVKALYDISVTNDVADAILIGRWAVNETKSMQMVSFI